MIDVKDAASFTHKRCTLQNGHEYHYIDQKGSSPDSPVCLMIHGFPDLWYGWRHQIKAFSEAGYRVIVPTQLGYYPSSQPDDLHAYGFQRLAADMVQLLDQAGVSKRIHLIGHDWGGALSWSLASLFLDRIQSIAVLCVPYPPPASKSMPFIDTEELVNKFLPNFGYQVFFASDEGGDLLAKNTNALLVPCHSSVFKERTAGQPVNREWVLPGKTLPRYRKIDAARQKGQHFPVPTEEEDPELHVYLDAYEKGGIRKPLSYYKTRKVNYDDQIASKASAQFPSTVPALFVSPTDDPALPTLMSNNSAQYFKGIYERVIIEGADHWLHQDPKYLNKVNQLLLDWAEKNDSKGQKARL